MFMSNNKFIDFYNVQHWSRQMTKRVIEERSKDDPRQREVSLG